MADVCVRKVHSLGPCRVCVCFFYIYMYMRAVGGAYVQKYESAGACQQPKCGFANSRRQPPRSPTRYTGRAATKETRQKKKDPTP